MKKKLALFYFIILLTCVCVSIPQKLENVWLAARRSYPQKRKQQKCCKPRILAQKIFPQKHSRDFILNYKNSVAQRCLIVKYLFDSFYCFSYFFYYLCNSFWRTRKLEQSQIWTDFTRAIQFFFPLFPIASPYIIAQIVWTAYTSACMVFRVNSLQYKLNWLLSWRGLAVVCDCDLSWCIIKLIIGFWIWNYEALCCHSFAVLKPISSLLLNIISRCDMVCNCNPIDECPRFGSCVGLWRMNLRINKYTTM